MASLSKERNIKRKTVQITLTESCNLNCIYCYEKIKDTSEMSERLAKKIIEDAFENSSSFDELEFNFHGGEISMAFPLLSRICEWLWSKHWNKPYICFSSTNGTLIHGKIQDWFKKHKDRYWLGLSIDGTREMHNKNRDNSYDLIDRNFFLTNWPKQSVKMTITADTLPSLYEGIKFLHEEGFTVSANLAYGLNPLENLNLKCYMKELKKLAEFYLENPEIKPATLLSFPIVSIGFAKNKEAFSIKNHRWCGCGKQMICFAPDGRSYPCQTFMPSTTSLDGDKLLGKIDFTDDTIFYDSMCENCCLSAGCPTCYAYNYLERGKINERDQKICKIRKTEALVSSYLYGKMLINRNKYIATRSLSNETEKYLIEGIYIIQEKIDMEVDFD